MLKIIISFATRFLRHKQLKISINILAYLLIATFTATAKAELNCNHTADSFKCVQFVRNYDGNTITINIDNVHPLIADKVKIDLKNTITPRIRARSKCEKDLAKKAKKFVQTKLKKAKIINITEAERLTKFGFQGNVIADGENIAESLIAQQLAVRKTAEVKNAKNIDWCNNNSSSQ